ncbi:MAG: FlgD immunoglobulin-like domain containing protein [Spirochaetia bacterium]|jgi:flagellar hook assembly protein FlgD/outer membrane protein OmpA-like peptidoglycan-associated protein
MKNQVRRFIVVALFAFAAGAVNGESGFLDFYSPQFLGGMGGTANLNSPQGTVLNPAVAGGKQRVTLDLSYLALTGVSQNPVALDGNFLNVGVTIPSNVGVFSTTGRFTNATFSGSAPNWGALGGLTFAFSKDLFPDLYVGAGLGGEFGSDWGLGLDLGFLHIPGDLGLLKDFRWGAAIRNITFKGYNASNAPGSLTNPPVFTPAVGAHFSLIRTAPFVLSLDPDISFPSFQDLQATIGADILIANFLILSGSYMYDLRQAAGIEPSRSLPFTFGVSFKITTNIQQNIGSLNATEQGWNRSEVTSTAVAAPLENGVWAFGLGANVPLGAIEKNPPAIGLDTNGEKYISPTLVGGKVDLILPLSITSKRYIKGYKLVIQDSSGTPVRTIQNKEDRPENRDLGNLVKRLFYVKSGIPVPSSIRWDGTSDKGTVVPDGTYQYFVEAWDDNGNIGRTPLGTTIVKTVPPQISVSAQYLIFSPTGEGTKAALPVHQTGSKEDLWSGVIKDAAGGTVRTLTWKDSAPPDFEWDGKNDKGVLAPDGVYSYHVAATDRAQNSNAAELDNIIINTQATPVQLSIDYAYFSPGTESPKKAVAFALGVPVKTGIENWTLDVSEASGAVQRTFSGKVSIPASVEWDGKDDKGKVLPDGGYKAKLAIMYVNGHNPTADSPLITIKTTPPTAAVSAEYEVFSPTGDSERNTVTIHQDTSEELFWTGTFKDDKGKDVRTMVWRGTADRAFQWDGRTDDGALLPDGAYTYELSSTDRAGNTGSSKLITLRIDTQKKPVRLSTDLAYFSPFGGGSKTKLKIIPALAVTTGVESFVVRVKNAKGDVIRTFKGSNRPPEELSWAGIDDAGNRAPDGQYSAELQVTYSNGTHPTAQSNPFFIDNHFPQVDVSADVTLFSPDGTSRQQSVLIKQSSSDEDLWEGELHNAKNERVRGWFWKGKAVDFSWDGKDDNGNVVPDASYTYVVKSQTKAGNQTVKELRGIVVDTRATPVFLTASTTGFSPTPTGVPNTIGFSPIVSLKDGIRSWKLSMLNAGGTSVKDFNGQAPVPSSLTWDGKDEAAATAPDGLYTADLQVDYFKGNLAETKTPAFALNATGPKVDITLGGVPFSPDNDGYNDELTIGLKVTDPSPIDTWNIQIMDPENHPFASFSGKGTPSDKIIWNGLSDTGELVQSAEDYPLTFTIKDVLGNTATYNKTIPVDILVVKDGNNLKIRIPSITFQANTADFTHVDPDKAAKNIATIARLSEIFKKYNQYKITIQGHANLVNFDNPVAAKKEQEQELIPLSKARAEAIKQALTAQGIDAGRISTVGIGGAEPVVPFSDLDNRWKNRRVEFILVRSEGS